MRNSPIEILVVGGGIALGVLLVHTLTEGASALTQLLALLSAGLALFCIQLALVQRRARRDGSPPEQQDQASFRPLRRRARNPFARELTHDWIGLEDPSTERDLGGASAPNNLDDELWGQPPEVVVRKAAAKKIDDPQ